MPRKTVMWFTIFLLFGGFILSPAAVWGLSLMEAVEQSAKKIAEELPPKSRVAIIAFESPNDNLSDYIMDELTGALFERGIEVADRRNLDYVFKELNFQASGEVDEKTAQSIGKFLGAQLVITGQLTSQGKNYRYRTSAILVEKATLASLTRLDVDNDKALKNLITTMSKQKNTVKTAKYGVDERTDPKTAGTFLDRGILFATRGDYEMAIMDFTDAIKLAPNLAAAYMLRGRALFASVSEVTGIGDNFSRVSTIYETHIATARNKLTVWIRLQQISSGFICDKTIVSEDIVSELYDLRSDEIQWIGTMNPKLEQLYEDVEGCHKPCIIATRYTAEAERIFNDLSSQYRCCLMTRWKKVGTVEEFQEGKYDVMVANIAVISRGFNLQNAHVILIYSNTFSLALRIQVEDRIYRIGQHNICQYYDYIYEDSVDEKIVHSLRLKRNLLDFISSHDIKRGTV